MQRNTSHVELEMTEPGKLPTAGQGHLENTREDSETLDKINHDIRSSINIIIGYTQLMLAQTTGKINSKQRKALQDILRSTNRLNELTEAVIRRLDTLSEKKN